MIVTGNNYGADVGSGRHDASIACILLGDGKGNFDAIPAHESGFSVKGDSRGIYSIQNGAQESFWVLRNKGSIAGFTLSQ